MFVLCDGFDFQRGDQVPPRVGAGVNQAVYPLPTTVCANLAFSERSLKSFSGISPYKTAKTVDNTDGSEH